MKVRRLAVVATALGSLLSLAACSSSTGASTSAAGSGGSAQETVIRIPDNGNSGVLALGKKDGSLARALAAVHAKVEWTGSAGAFAPAAQELDANELDVAEGSITSATTALAQSPASSCSPPSPRTGSARASW